MTLIEIFKWVENNILAVSLASMTIVQVAPLKIDPWTKLFTWIGNIMIKPALEDINEIKKRMDLFESNQTFCRNIQTQKWAEDSRWNVLYFANSVRNGKKHTKEEWEHVIAQIIVYEKFCKENKVDNERMVVECAYLREKYKHRIEKQDWLVGKPNRGD